MTYKPVKKFMREAIKQGKIAGNKKEYAIGAIVVKENKIISKGHQLCRTQKDPSLHAEIAAIKKAAKKLKTKYLKGCVLYTTNEPCPMCTACAIWADMKGIVFGANVKDMGSYWKKRGSRVRFDVPAKDILNKQKPRKLFLIKNFMRKECLKLFEYYRI